METTIKEKKTKMALRASMLPKAADTFIIEAAERSADSANPMHILPLVRSKEMCYSDLLDDDKVVQLKKFYTISQKSKFSVE